MRVSNASTGVVISLKSVFKEIRFSVNKEMEDSVQYHQNMLFESVRYQHDEQTAQPNRTFMNPIKILILTANPKIPNYEPLRLDAEVRQIEEALKRSRCRERFQLETQLATRTKDLRRALLDHQPQIVHFSGHGSGEQGLVLENDDGKLQLVSTEALTQLFGTSEISEVECVLLNACYSEVQASAIHQIVDCVIGMDQPIGDKAAILFAEGFYDALGAGKPFEFAFRFGRNAIQMVNTSEYITPKLIKKNIGELFVDSAQERTVSQDKNEREIYNFRSFYSNSKKTGVNVHIYWHQKGLTLEDANAMKAEFEQEGIPTAILQHHDPNPPDSIFIGTLVSAQEARTVLSKVPYEIEYIFPANYPRIEGGDPNGLLIGVGYMSGHNQENRIQASTLIKLSPSDVASLIETGISNVEFQRRLRNLLQTA